MDKKLTKAELQVENDLLREIASSSTNISNCTFTGSASDAQCEAIIEIAKALKHAAKALQAAPSLVINGG